LGGDSGKQLGDRMFDEILCALAKDGQDVEKLLADAQVHVMGGFPPSIK
jgi:hypothetical protein